MFASAEAGNACSKEEFDREAPPLRVDLLNAQYELRSRDFAVLICLAGDDRRGVEETFDLLHEWLDARRLDAHAFTEPSDEERERPRFWRYWRALPPAGRTGVFVGGWITSTLVDRIDGELDDDFAQRIEQDRKFESDLVADGTLVLKLWLHVPRAVLQKRVKRAKKHPEEVHYVEARDAQIAERWDELRPDVEHYLQSTNTAEAPWTVVESTDEQYRDLTVARALRDALTRRLAQPPAPKQKATPPPPPSARNGVLATVDLSASLAKDEYDEQVEKLQARLYKRSIRARQKARTSVLVFEGWDAAGKGGAIRRLTHAMSARDYRVVPIAAPSEEERAFHWLWRFWRQLPRAGRMLIFDRSWYGRVLVERVEGFATEAEWTRAYDEIIAFETQLLEHGIALLKFWLHVDEAEQMRRFHERAATPYKEYKITEEDFRNRSKRAAYDVAVDDMVARTSTKAAPWVLVPANDKRFARIEILRRVCDALE